MATFDHDLEGLRTLLLLSRDFTTRQASDIASPVIVAAVTVLASLAFHLLLPFLAPFLGIQRESSLSDGLPVPLLSPLSMPGLPAVALSVTRSERPRLQNHPQCGLTTGGQVMIWNLFKHFFLPEICLRLYSYFQ